MARPASTPPPVQTAVVPRREESTEVAAYRQLAEAFRRPDRHAELVAMLGSDDLVARFVTVTLAAMNRDPGLLRNATLPSIIQAVKDSAGLGLEPTGLTGEAWILCYGDQATLIPGWRGYLKRIRNSGTVRGVQTDVVYREDDWWYERTHEGFKYRHQPAQTDVDPATGQILVSRGDYKGAYASVIFNNGFPDGEYMSATEINKVRDDHSSARRGGRKSPWDTDWGEMARKTVLKRLCKRLPQSAAVEALLMADAIADQRRDELGATAGEGNIDISKPQRAAIAAVNRARGLPEIAAPVEPEPSAQNVFEGVTEEGVKAALASETPVAPPNRAPEEPTDFDVEDEPELPI